MTPDVVRARLASLHAAGEELRRRSAEDVIEALAAVLERWRDPASAERVALERELPHETGLGAQTIHEGLTRALAVWPGSALRGLARRELGTGGALRMGHDVTAVLLAGSIPMPTLLGMIAPLALRSPVLARSSARDRITARLVQGSISEVDAALGRCVEVVHFPHDDAECMKQFLSAPCVVANGSDETLAAVEERMGPTQRLVRHAHRLSIAVLGSEATHRHGLRAAARGIGLDTALWDQLGCASPQAVYVVGDVETGRQVGIAIGRVLEGLEKQMPRGAVEPEAAALAAHERAVVELREVAGKPVMLRAAADGAWTVVCEEDATPRPAPLHRFLRIHPVASVAELEAALAPVAPRLAAVAVAGFGSEEPVVRRTLWRLGASRVCEPGELQTPPLDWPRDGHAPLGSLATPR